MYIHANNIMHRDIKAGVHHNPIELTAGFAGLGKWKCGCVKAMLLLTGLPYPGSQHLNASSHGMQDMIVEIKDNSGDR